MLNHKLISAESLEELLHGNYIKVFELLHTGIAMISPEGEYLYVNQAFLDMFNLPEDTVGQHVSNFFLTWEGVMTTIRTKKMTVCTSLTKTNGKGVSFRYPILNSQGDLLGLMVECITTSIGQERLLDLLDMIGSLAQQTEYFERKSQKQLGMLFTFSSIVGESKAMQSMKERGRRFARSHEPILLFGESGTGKELVAQALHSASERVGKPFVTVNCAALPHELMESELFGYVAGSFTGAKSGGMKGKFELADGGTIFLDEIGELSLSMQAKLLRVLESGEIQKIGHHGYLHSDFRLIAATNKDLPKLVDSGSFREDLYHRLSILELRIPALRERRSDIPLLCRYFIEQSVGPKRTREIQVSSELLKAFSLYPWRGNIRELKNVLTYALYSLEGQGNVLNAVHLPERFFLELNNEYSSTAADVKIEERSLNRAGALAERQMLAAVLKSVGQNKSKAAEVLGISRNKLYRKMRAFGLQ